MQDSGITPESHCNLPVGALQNATNDMRRLLQDFDHINNAPLNNGVLPAPETLRFACHGLALIVRQDLGGISVV